MRKKYEALGTFLKAQAAHSEVRLTFGEIERIIGSKLPPSAYDHRPWWSNNPSNNVMTKVWLAAGFETEQVDMDGKKLVFRNSAKMVRDFESIEGASDAAKAIAAGMAEGAREFKPADVEKKPRRSPLFGALKGTFTIESGYDLTSPSMDADELAEWEASLDRKADLYEKGLSGKKK